MGRALPPTYPNALYERVLTAMQIGCGIISDFAPVLASTFRQGIEWLHAPPGASANDLLARLGVDGAAAIADAAKSATCSRFGMVKHVDHLLAGLHASSPK